VWLSGAEEIQIRLHYFWYQQVQSAGILSVGGGRPVMIRSAKNTSRQPATFIAPQAKDTLY